MRRDSLLPDCSEVRFTVRDNNMNRRIDGNNPIRSEKAGEQNDARRWLDLCEFSEVLSQNFRADTLGHNEDPARIEALLCRRYAIGRHGILRFATAVIALTGAGATLVESKDGKARLNKEVGHVPVRITRNRAGMMNNEYQGRLVAVGQVQLAGQRNARGRYGHFALLAHQRAKCRRWINVGCTCCAWQGRRLATNLLINQ